MLRIGSILAVLTIGSALASAQQSANFGTPISRVDQRATSRPNVERPDWRSGNDQLVRKLAATVGAKSAAPGSDGGAGLYAAACSSCHYRGRGTPDFGDDNPAEESDPAELIGVVLFGVVDDDGSAEMRMPGFADAFTDADVARLVAHMRAVGSSEAPWPDLTKTVAAVRARGEQH